MSRLNQISGCDNVNRKADVIFVHGLGGDAFKTWRNSEDETTSWLHWIGQEFSNVGVWSLGYAASPTKFARLLRWLPGSSRDSGHSMALPDRALQVMDLMTQKGFGQRPILFICHSLGGLLVKQILRKSSDATEPHNHITSATRAVLFLATPHTGVILASFLNDFRKILGATVSIEELHEHDAHLRDLHNWYRNHAQQYSIETVTYYELRAIAGILPIVNPTSAHPGVGRDPVGLDEDHLSIAKPRESDAQVYYAACNLIRDHLLATPRDLPPATVDVPSSLLPAQREIVVKLEPQLPASESPRIACELPPPAYKFFGRKTERTILIERLRVGMNTAVVGPAGLGKTALAADALKEVVGANANKLSASPFPDGVVYLDLYTLHGQAEPAWNTLANRLRGAEFLDRRPARDRATEACRARRILVIIEGGEEADESIGRTTIQELFSVLSPENRWLLLTRVNTQSAVAETVEIKDALNPEEAKALFDFITSKHSMTSEFRRMVIELLEGHPLALSWAGNLLARGDEDPESLADDWKASGLPSLSDPRDAEHTLRWLYERSIRGLDDAAKHVLAAAGLLARAPFPLGAIAAAIGDVDASGNAVKRARGAQKNLVQRGLMRQFDKDRWQFTHVLAYRFARDENGTDPELRKRLGNWLNAELVTALRTSEGDTKNTSFTLLLEHSAALLRADYNQQLWDPLVEGLLYGISDRCEEIGRLDLVRLSLRAVEEWLARIPKDEAEQPFWLNQCWALNVDQGDLLCDQGDLTEALAAYQKALAMSQRLARTDPSNTGWQRIRSVSQERIGDVLRTKGDLAGALAAYRESLTVRQRLAATDPSNTKWQRDLSVNHNNVGFVLYNQGDRAGALAAFQESLAVRQRLATADSTNTEWQRDLSVSHVNVGNVLYDQGDLTGALAAYQESLVVSKRLAAADPSNTVWQRDLSVSLENIGNVLHDQGNLVGALTAFQESLAVRQRLTATDHSNTVWQRDLCLSNKNVGNVLRDQGDLTGALAAYQESLVVRQRLAAADPSNAEWQRDLSISLMKLAECHEIIGDKMAALLHAENSLSINERLVALDRSNVTWQKDAEVIHGLITRLRGDLR